MYVHVGVEVYYMSMYINGPGALVAWKYVLPFLCDAIVSIRSLGKSTQVPDVMTNESKLTLHFVLSTTVAQHGFTAAYTLLSPGQCAVMWFVLIRITVSCRPCSVQT